MNKYLINETIHGYEKVLIDDIKLTNEKDSLIIIIVDKSCDENIGLYYKVVNNTLKNRNRVILISLEDGNKIFKVLASLMVTYNSYDIYEVAERSLISAPYLIKIEDRQPDLTEVQTYIGGDVTAYSDISTILFGIESLVDEGDQDKLKAFLEEHMISIENLTCTLNNMKKTCDIFNSNELLDKINKLKSQEDLLNKKLDDKDKDIEEIKYDRDKHKVEVENLKRDNEKLKNKNSLLQNQTEAGAPVIKTYKELNTQLINCKTKIILYFKEISYVQYTNSLVEQILNVLNTRGLKAKLLIYDSRSELYLTYKPLPVVQGSDYLSMKSTLISKTKQFVVAEPNPSILNDMLTSDQCFDVVIIYDRMKGLSDIVSGNNVSKFYVINSSKDYNELKNTLKINDTSSIITRNSSSIEKSADKKKDVVKHFLDIPAIANYNSNTDSGKTNKYMKLVTAASKVPLIDTIIKKSRIDTLY